MGCGSSTLSNQGLPDSVQFVVSPPPALPESTQPASGERVTEEPVLQQQEASVKKGGNSLGRPERKISRRPSLKQDKKWAMLMDWTAWRTKDQFGWDQPELAEIVGSEGRSKLGDVERPHDYQVAVSFPGADFDKGAEGHRADLQDHTGSIIASSGTDMAEALHHWLVKDWLNGNEKQGLTHSFVCSINLKHCSGSVKAKNFRPYGSTEAGKEEATAILNENWSMYLRESFLEARVIVFVVNEDWLDSIPCNQEFEALITRKRRFRPDSKDAIIFFDITDNKFNRRWGAKLPQLKESMASEAKRYFDVYQLTYNAQTSSEGKLSAQKEFVDIVQKYCQKFEVPDTLAFKDYAAEAREVDWPNWMFYGALEGTNGWQALAEVRDIDLQANYQPALVNTTQEVASRRFRVRMVGVTGDVFNEGYKIMLTEDPQLVDKATGENIIGYGKGYYKMSGERLADRGVLCFQHWCGTKQYSVLEWLVPDDRPPVVLSQVRINTNVRHWTLEAMPVDVWPRHGEALADFTFLSAPASGAVATPTWVPLHSMDSHEWLPGSTAAEFALPAALPACGQFRLRVLSTAGDPEACRGMLGFNLQLKAQMPAGTYPIGGGEVTGSGGDAEMEHAPPSMAFDGDLETRWVDAKAGGIGNTAHWLYEHVEPVRVSSYRVMSQINALSSYHSGLAGAPRDWKLKAFVGGEWVVVDEQRHVYFSKHRETKEFRVSSPVASSKYMFEFTAVAAGCNSKSLQVGDIQLLAEAPAGEVVLRAHQFFVSASAYHPTSHQLSRSWAQPDQLSVCLPVHPSGLGVAAGGEIAWGGQVDNWYDWAMVNKMEPKAGPDPDDPITTVTMLCVRPRKETILVDQVHNVSFRETYTEKEALLTFTHTRPFILQGYGLGSSANYVRGDPRDWALEAEMPDGQWQALHSVEDFVFQTRFEPACFYLKDNNVSSRRYRFVFSRMNAMVGLLHLRNPFFLMAQEAQQGEAAHSGSAGSNGDGAAAGEGQVSTECEPLARSEVAHVTLRVKPREGEQGTVVLAGYTVGCDCGGSGSVLQPTGWVLEGLTTPNA